MRVAASQTTSERSAARLASLDVMRGIAVAGMILVNNPGSWDDGYAFLAHAPWNGWTLADLVFPFFLVIVGVSLDLSLSRRSSGRSALLPALVRRAALLCALGILLNVFPDLSQLGSVRWFGVLQRIGLCTLAVGTLLLTTGARTQVAVAAALLAGYWLAMTTVPVPGYGAGVLTPEGNLAAWLDVRWFGGHLYREGFDPEGLLSTLPAVATTLIGALAGRFLRGGRPGHEKTLGLIAAGTALALAGEIAGWWFPINKQLWTSSYVLLTGGLGLATLGVCYELIDRRGWRLGTRPFLMLGSNALAVYLLSSLGARLMEICQISAGESCESLRRFLYEQLFQPWAGAETGSLCFAIAYLLVWLIPTAELHRRRVFLKI